MDFISSWINVLTHPSVATFDAEKAKASNQKTLIAIIIAAVVSAILGAILLAIVGTTVTALTGFNVTAAVGTTAIIRGFISSLVNTIIQFYVFAWLVTFVAGRLFGGTGKFEEQAYLISTYFVPLTIINSILIFIPVIGWIISIILLILGLFLTTYAVESEQGISGGNSVITWILSGIGAGIVVGIISAVTFGWL